jgi:FMN phosphatase YigB (HAD superfamily)
MLDRLAARGIEKAQILHTAESLFHDHAPANDFGLATCWIHRRHEQGGFGATMNPGKTPHTDFRFTSMAALADAHRQATPNAG